MLSDKQILQAIETGEIVISPFDRELLGPNSYDVHLSDTLMVYDDVTWYDHWRKAYYPANFAQNDGFFRFLNPKKELETISFKIPEEGHILMPGVLYLGATVEYTESHKHVPDIDGKSSVGRLGIDIHKTAGRGDVGFCGTFTLELQVVHPVKVYAGMPIGQLYWTETGEVERPYNTKKGSKYNGQREPVASKMWQNFKTN